MVRHKNRYLLFHVHWITPPSQTTKQGGTSAGKALARLSGQSTATVQHDDTEKVQLLPNGPALEAAGVHTLHGGQLLKVIRDAISLNMGDLGVGSTSTLNVKYYNAETCVGILRVPMHQHQSVWATLSTITEIKGVKCTIRVVHASGTIQRCQEHALHDDQKRLRYLRYLQLMSKPKIQ